MISVFTSRSLYICSLPLPPTLDSSTHIFNVQNMHASTHTLIHTHTHTHTYTHTHTCILIADCYCNPPKCTSNSVFLSFSCPGKAWQLCWSKPAGRSIQRQHLHQEQLNVSHALLHSSLWPSSIYTPSSTLRSASDTVSLQIPRTRLCTASSNTFFIFGPSTWNHLPLPLWTHSNPTLRHFFFQNNRPAMLSILCCYLPPLSNPCLLSV